MIDMNRRRALVAGGTCLGVLLSGCLGGASDGGSGSERATWTASGTPITITETPTYDCDDADRPAPPGPDDDPPGDDARYDYPTRPGSLSDESVRPYLGRYERAYRLNKLRARHGQYLNHASVDVEETVTFGAPDGTAVAQVKYTYDAEIEGDDGPIEIGPSTMYASYYLDDVVVIRAVNERFQGDTSRLVVDPVEEGKPVECF